MIGGGSTVTTVAYTREINLRRINNDKRKVV